MNKHLLEILACPICKGNLIYLKDKKELLCLFDKLAFAIKDDIPIMLEGEARKMSLEEVDKLKKK